MYRFNTLKVYTIYTMGNIKSISDRLEQISVRIKKIFDKEKKLYFLFQLKRDEINDSFLREETGILVPFFK